jgi:hypothetical protein
MRIISWNIANAGKCRSNSLFENSSTVERACYAAVLLVNTEYTAVFLNGAVSGNLSPLPPSSGNFQHMGEYALPSSQDLCESMALIWRHSFAVDSRFGTRCPGREARCFGESQCQRGKDHGLYQRV